MGLYLNKFRNGAAKAVWHHITHYNVDCKYVLFIILNTSY